MGERRTKGGGHNFVTIQLYLKYDYSAINHQQSPCLILIYLYCLF